ncbi:NAD(P)H-dependent oxidoreductase subunit E [Sneathiella limimaris]|uniref:NAD(P)H-dependent oxidoreductase subunit E n=1 Tax=Sneathiella limimaris TaxID=1964213 RepID=UPI00146C65E1|nr:NAD(P)H-dependent oxidoreductase subunit E [Sneathiella limimaris]
MSKTASFAQTTAAPGKARQNRKGRYAPRGRQASPRALEEVRAILKDMPRDKDLLIEHLHRLQDEFGYLAKDHLAALATETRLSLAEVYEVATFYHNFVVAETEEDLPRLTVKVCDSLTCELKGSRNLTEQLTENYGKSVQVTHGACMGRCDKAPVVRLEDQYVTKATIENSKFAIDKALTGNTASQVDLDHLSYSDYCENGGFKLLQKICDGDLDYQTVIDELKKSGHRGLGGAGFPHAMKIESVCSIPGPRLMAVNADESEPGTFKDRYYMNTNPYQFLEGMLIGADLVDAEAIYIFLRDEYPDTARILKTAIADLEIAGLTKGRPIHLRRGAGAYICGEESAMLESLEGKRALPRQKPPFPAHVGLFGRPTLINNVETLYWLPDILTKGADWYQDGGRHSSKGFRTFSLSGHVKKPGVYRVPAGITATELITEYGGGMEDGHVFRAYLPGGASGGMLPASMADIPLDFGTLEEHGCFIGSAAVIVLSDQDDLKDVCRNLMRFFEDESCGQCTPCRIGTIKALDLMAADSWDQPLLEELSAVMRDASICGLGQAAPNALLCLMKYFPEELS